MLQIFAANSVNISRISTPLFLTLLSFCFYLTRSLHSFLFWMGHVDYVTTFPAPSLSFAS